MEKGLEMVTSDDWLRGFAIMSKIFSVTENDLDEIKQKFDTKYKTEILTDIRDYLEKTKKTWKENNEILGTDLPLFALNRFIYDLTEYAEKLGVEL